MREEDNTKQRKKKQKKSHADFKNCKHIHPSLLWVRINSDKAMLNEEEQRKKQHTIDVQAMVHIDHDTKRSLSISLVI